MGSGADLMGVELASTPGAYREPIGWQVSSSSSDAEDSPLGQVGIHHQHQRHDRSVAGPRNPTDPTAAPRTPDQTLLGSGSAIVSRSPSSASTLFFSSSGLLSSVEFRLETLDSFCDCQIVIVRFLVVAGEK